MLGNRADAEDAFQAVFLVLAQRAVSFRRDASLPGWLHEVAVRVCLNERKMNRRRQQRLQQAAEAASLAPRLEPPEDLKLEIDEALAALPARLRDVLVLCDLEGRTRAEAAQMLNLAPGTLASRLARGREAMRRQLRRRGALITAGGIAAALAEYSEAVPEVSASLIETTLRNTQVFLAGSAVAGAVVGLKVRTLADGVHHAMLLSQWKTAACLAALAVTSLFGGALLPSVPGSPRSARADTVFRDDFQDGDPTDGSPVAWRVGVLWPETQFSVINGDLRLTTTDLTRSGVLGVDLPLTDTSIRAQVRLEGVGEAGVGLAARANDQEDEAYQMQLVADGVLWFGVGGSLSGSYDRIATDLRPTNEDVILQLDAIGDRIDFWAWRASETKPDSPLATLIDERISAGLPGIFVTPSGVDSPSTAIFRYVHVDTVPEPSTAALSAFGLVFLAVGTALRRHRRPL